MKNYYNVSFQYSESSYCANIAHAESVEDVEKHYSKYAWFKVSPASEYDVTDAQRRGKPIVEIEHVEEPEHEPQPAEAGEKTENRKDDKKMTATYTLNNELNGIEITFDAIPAPAIRNLLKSSGFAWHRVKGLWYAKQSAERIELCKAIVEQLNGTEAAQESAQTAQKPAKAPALAPLWERVQTSDLPAYGTENAMKNEIRATAKEKGWGYDRACADYFRKHLKARFPECKFSITSGGAGYLDSCEISLKAAPYEKDSPELDAIMKYADALHDATDADDGDYYGDYGPSHDLYGNAHISWEYTQTAQTDEIRAECEAFRAAKEAHEKAEEEKRAREYAEEQARREIEAKEAAEREKRDAARAEEIENSAEVVDLYEGEQLTFTELIGGTGKEAGADELRETLADHPQRNDAIISRRVKFASANDLAFFENNFLRDWSFLAGKGGMKSADVRVSDENYSRLNAEQRETVKWYCVDCVAVYLGEELKYIIDPEGYTYARYVYIPSESTEEIPAAVYEGREEAESREKEPLYIPASISEQIEAADFQSGEAVTVISSDGFCGVSTASGKIVSLDSCSYAQYTDAGKLIMIPAGKRKAGGMYIYGGRDTLIYRGILPAIPDSLKYIDVGPNMRRYRAMGADYKDYLKDVVKYYAAMGHTPALDTFQR